MREVSTGQHITTLTEPSNFVTCFAYSPDGTRLVTGSGDARNGEHTVKLWDIETGKSLTTLRGHTDVVITVAYSQDGTLLASGSKDKTVKLWEVSTGENIATLQGHKKMVFSVAFSPDGTKLASGSEDTSIRLWEVPTGKALYILGGVNSPQVPVEVLPATRPGEEISEVQGNDATDIEPEIIRALVFSVAFSPDGTKLASASWDGVKLWDVGAGQYFATLAKEPEPSSFSVAFSPDGTKLACGSWEDRVELWDVSTQKHIASFPGHTGWVRAVVFSSDGTKIASGSVDGTALLWDVPKSIKLYPSKQHSD